jgi:recombinational DNA repair ATPase RecF
MPLRSLASTLLGRHPVVLFEPNDLNLLSGHARATSALFRRGFNTNQPALQKKLFNVSSQNCLSSAIPYCGTISACLVLKLDDQLFILDTQISPLAEEISHYRQNLLKDIEEILIQVVPRIAKKDHVMRVEFKQRSSDFMVRIQTARQS